MTTGIPGSAAKNSVQEAAGIVPSPTLRCPSRLLPSSFLASLRWTRPTASPSAARSSAATRPGPPGIARSYPATKAWAVSTQARTPARRVTSPRVSNVQKSWLPAPTEFSISGSAAGPEASASPLARSRPSTSRSSPFSSPSPPWLPEWTTTKSIPISPAAESSAARARTERSLRSALGDARLIRYFAWATVGWMPRSRAPAANSPASGRRTGSAQPWGLEMKIWTASQPRSSAFWSIFPSPAEVGRWRPMLLVLSCTATILTRKDGRVVRDIIPQRNRRRQRRRRWSAGRRELHGDRGQGGEDTWQQRDRAEQGTQRRRADRDGLRGLLPRGRGGLGPRHRRDFRDRRGRQGPGRGNGGKGAPLRRPPARDGR